MPTFNKPKIFFGSSVEGLPIADAIIANLKPDVDSTSWVNAFPLAENTINSLINGLKKNNFAVFILSPDDMTNIRGRELKTSRDNVLFEAGLAIGKYGKLNCFLVIPKNVPDFHIPTDFLGITTTSYEPSEIGSDAAKATMKCSKDIKDAIDGSLWKTLKLDLRSYVDPVDPNKLTLKNKIFIEFFNRERYSIRIELKEAKLKNLVFDPIHTIFGGRIYYDPVFIESKNGYEFSRQIDTIKSNELKKIWLPLETSISKTKLSQLLSNNNLGSLPITCELINNDQLIFEKEIIF